MIFFRYLLLTILFVNSADSYCSEVKPRFLFYTVPFEGKGIEAVAITDATSIKPLLLFCQGSLPIPVLINYSDTTNLLCPWITNAILERYTVLMISKPGVPLEAHVESLGPDYTYRDSTGNFPEDYIRNNHLDYYVKRNIAVIKHVLKSGDVITDGLVVAGHSEGATVAAKMAMEYGKIKYLIFASGNPVGRFMTMVQQSRSRETDSINLVNHDFEYLDFMNDNLKADSPDPGAFTDLSFSRPPMEYLEKLKIPVLICYGTKDYSAPFNDYFRFYAVQKGLDNLQFKDYLGLEHNFFEVGPDGRPDYNSFHWNEVAEDWMEWISSH